MPGNIKQEVNIVWLKRDLRTQDHAPLHEAELQKTPYRIVYIFDPELLAYPDTSERHLQFIYQSILEMNNTLAPFGRCVEVFYGDSVKVFDYLVMQEKILNVFSYQETGIQISWDRDKKVANFLQDHQVKWKEYQRDGIIRGIKNRNGWDKRWFITMSKPIIRNTFSRQVLKEQVNPFSIPTKLDNDLKKYPHDIQPAGEVNAWKYLESFVKYRGIKYHALISKPLESRTSCSRISPYLAWGNISIKQAYRFVKNHPQHANHKRAFGGFLTRLK